MRISSTKSEKKALKHISNEVLKDDLQLFDQSLGKQLSEQSEYLTENEYEMYRRGKKLRPILLLLFSRMVSGNEADLPSKCYKAASSLEMLHVASLIHDDIIDDSSYRRNLPSVHTSRGTGSAIILGDMQFLQAVRGFVDTISVQDDMELVRMLLDVALDVSKGELDEINAPKSEDYIKMRNRYLQTVERKTATLIGLACEAGIILAGGKRSDARRAGFFGRKFGMAFQIMDDVIDCVQKKEKSGKDGQSDLKNRTLSLPIIYALEYESDDSCLRKYMNDDKEILTDEIIDRVSKNGVVRAYECARKYAFEALELLDFFPHNRYTECLEQLLTELVDKV